MKKIAIEEHFYTEEHVKLLLSRKNLSGLEMSPDEKYWDIPQHLIDGNLDMGEGRLRDMDEAGIDMQVMSLLNPGVEVYDAATGTAMAKKVNDELAGVVAKYPGRFAGFATLTQQDPVAAADELERAVKKLGMKGAKINSHAGTEFLDEPKYWAIFEKAEKLGVPVYLHPRYPPPNMIEPYLKYSPLADSILGFAHETGLHAMRLICSGIFDKYPGLKIILGHLGEALPYWLWRMDSRWEKQWAGAHPNLLKLERKLSDYVKDNFFITTSGMFWIPAFLCAYLALGADRILFAIDYPMESNKEAVAFMDGLPISDVDKEKIYHINAEKLLGL